MGVATGLFNASYSSIGQLLQTTVARGDGAVTVGHAHHGFDKVTFFITHGVIHRAIGGPGFALSDVGTSAIAGAGGNGDDLVAHGVGLFLWVV